MRALPALVIVVLTAGCGSATIEARGDASTTPSNEAAAPAARDLGTLPPPAPVPADATVRPLRPASPVGSWQSSGCGDRRYLREMTFFADGRFTARDLMSPCPPQARCVWSGIIEWSGGWSLAGSTVTLIPSPGGRIPEAAPATLTLINDDPPGLAEKAGDVLCAYAPQP